MAKQQAISAITALPRSPQDDRRRRMTKYLVTMGIRIVCIVLCIFAKGWWLAFFAVGAVVLPYLAVVLANVGHESGDRPDVLRPGALVPVQRGARPQADSAEHADGAEQADDAEQAGNREQAVPPERADEPERREHPFDDGGER